MSDQRFHRRRTRIALVALVSALWLVAPPSLAELVEVRLSSADRGQGWLFGPERDGHCWLATPAHVLRGRDGTLERGIVTFGDGTEAQVAGAPIQPIDAIDLAFARVPRAGRCLDRLGLRQAERLIQAAEDVQLKKIQSGRITGFVVTTVEHDVRRGYVTVESRRADDKLVKGFSGSVLVSTQEGVGMANVPLGMLLSVCTPSDRIDPFAEPEDDAPTCDGEGHYGIALRFDRIRSVFDAHVASNAAATKGAEAPRAQAGPRLLSMRGSTLDARSGPDGALANPDLGVCWSAAVDASERVAVTIAREGVISRVSVRACADSGGEMPDGIQVRRRPRGASAWSTVRYCRRSSDRPDAIECRFAPFEADEIELEFHRRGARDGGLISIGSIDVE